MLVSFVWHMRLDFLANTVNIQVTLPVLIHKLLLELSPERPLIIVLLLIFQVLFVQASLHDEEAEPIRISLI